MFSTVFPRKPRSEHGEIIPAGAKYQNEVHPYHALALVWTHLHASRVLWMLCRFVEGVHIIDHFMVVLSVTLPMNINEAGDNPALI